MIKNNLLTYSLALAALYWILGAVPATNPYMSSAASLGLLIFGGVTAVRYAQEAWPIVVHGYRSDIEGTEGSHLAVYGISLIAVGSVYVGMYALIWTYMGQPDSWIGTPMSGFGRAIMGAGFSLVFFSPDVTRKGLRLPQGIWVLALAAMVLLAAFFVGVRVGTYQAMEDEAPSQIKMERVK